MKSPEEIERKIKEFELQKQQISMVSQIKGTEKEFETLVGSMMFLEKQISLLKWILSK